MPWLTAFASWSCSVLARLPHREGWNKVAVPSRISHHEVEKPRNLSLFRCSRDHVGPAPTLIADSLGCSSLWIQVREHSPHACEVLSCCP